ARETELIKHGQIFRFLVANGLRHRLLVLAAALVLVVYGSITLPLLPVDVFPDLNRPSVMLMTEAEGLAPQEVEQLVTFPIELAMNGMPGVIRVPCPASACRLYSSNSIGVWTSIVRDNSCPSDSPSSANT